MAAFHPRTFELLREALGAETVTHSLDAARLAKLPEGSKSLMAQQLREREAAYPAVSGDLKWLLDFMQRLTDQADRHATERATPEPDADLTTAMARHSSSHGTAAAYDTADPHDAALAQQARAEHVDYAEADAVREIEREMAIEAGDDSELDRQVAEDDARNERKYEAHEAKEAWLDAHPDEFVPEDYIGPTGIGSSTPGGAL